jgi:hypothetical protein
MWRRKTTGIVAVVLGVVLFIAGLIDHAFAAPKAALCQSGLGQLAQGFDGTVAHDCGLVTSLESAVGWLLVAGVLIAVFGAAVLYRARNLKNLTSPKAAPEHAGPAGRPWWNRT